MSSPRLSLFQFGIVLAALFLFFGMSSVKPVFAVTTEEIKNISAGLRTDSGMISNAAELAGVDAPLVKKFRLGVKYGEFAERLAQGDYWGVAADFIKFQLDKEVDKLTDLTSKKLLSAGAQRLVGVFTALKDTGIWLGNKALDAQFNDGVKAGYEIYKANVGQADFRDMMDIWWVQFGKGKITKINDKEITEEMWIEKFGQIYAIEKKLTEKPPTAEDIKTTAKVIKKTAVVDFFKLKYSGIGINVAEEFADAIVNNASPAVIEQIAEKYKNHLDSLTAAGAEGGMVSSGGICGAVKEIKDEDDKKDCEEFLAKIVDERKQILSNRKTYDSNFWQYQLQGNYSWGINEENLAKFKKGQIDIIASAYESQFGQEIRAVNDSLAASKDAFQNLKSDYKNLPEGGDHWNTPSYRVSINKGFAGFFNNVYNMAFHYGSFDYGDFKSGVAQNNYERYLENEPKANAADDARARYLKAHLARANSLVRDFTILQNRINSLILSAESAGGVFSYGQVTINDLKKMVSEIDGLKEDIKSGERPWWSFWRQQEKWSIDSASETIKWMESDKKERESSIGQLKKDYASTLKTYEEEEKQRELEKQKQAEEEKKAAAEKEARALQKQKAEEEAWNKEKERLEAEKKAAAEKAGSEQITDKFNVPFGETPKTDATQPATTPTIPTKPTPAQTESTRPSGMESTLPSGLGSIPNENEEIAGFSFIAGWKADMMVSDFFWNDGGVYTINGALDLGLKSLNDITSVPASGYKEDPFQPEVNHVYAIKTRDGKYGIIRIGFIEEGRQLNFSWRYQPDGSTSF